MMNQPYRLIKPFLLMAFSFLLITACYTPVTQKTDISLATSSECRVVQHKLGEICIPIRPQRIITLNPRYLTDPVLALGIKPVGMATYNELGITSFPGLSADEVAGIENVGDASQPSLEKILLLKPDLILALDIYQETIYKQLTAIAPTVLVQYNRKNLFKENFRYIAQLFGQEKKAEEVLTQYQNRIEKLKERLGKQLQEIEISVIFYYHGVFSTATTGSTCSQIFADMGLRHKTATSLSDSGTFSIEAISKYDTDILFIYNGDNKPSSFYVQNPLIALLKAVQNKRAYMVDPTIWGGNGPLGVNKILDDLFKYLPKGA
ncbi:MAG: iron-siderophore ABC transporter substrate-binding protein [Goleter apudmare HA4340-LM2]|nr:iron-siderophore ABC transporter substrate-binding protein [Goleter apudmare HA4340-LM2]